MDDALTRTGGGLQTVFQADLEWLMRPSNFIKVIEGKYSDGR